MHWTRFSKRLTTRLAIGLVAAGLAAVPTTTTHAATAPGGAVNGLESYNTPFLLGCAASANVFLEDLASGTTISLTVTGALCLTGETGSATVNASGSWGGCTPTGTAPWARTSEVTPVTFNGSGCSVTFVLAWTDGASSIIPGPSFNSGVIWGAWAA